MLRRKGRLKRVGDWPLVSSHDSNWRVFRKE